MENNKSEREEWEELKKELYKTPSVIQSDIGNFDFSDKDIDKIVGPKITYDEYLEAQFAARHEQRTYFFMCYLYPYDCSFKGRVEINNGKRILFTHIDVDVYRYIKTRNEKKLAYGLCNPEYIEKIPSYEVPTDEELMEQFVDQLICETCLFTDHCYGTGCIANQEEKEEKKKMMLSFLKEGKEKRP